jgi:hypothetical protein
MRFDATADAVWRGIRFYEDVPGTPAWWLRLFLPRPVRTDGAKSQPGALVRCTYDGGHLVKRITAVETPRLVSFGVVEQHLGIEGAVSMVEGSYEIRAAGDGAEIVLTTWYRGHMRPRWLFRALERLLADQVHRHILRGMREIVAREPHSSVVAAPSKSARMSGEAWIENGRA